MAYLPSQRIKVLVFVGDGAADVADPHRDRTNILCTTKAVDEEKKAEDSAIEQLKKYKELFDEGVITQEEFDAKKKQLLGL